MQTIPRNQKRQLFTKTLLVGVCFLTVGLIPNWEDQIKQLDKLQVLGKTRTKISDTTAAPELAAIVENPTITARSALAYDFSSGSILYTYNFDTRVPIASLTKLLTAVVIAESGKLDEIVTITEEDIKVIGPNTGLVKDERIKVSELMKAMLIASHNDSTRALSRHVGGTSEHFVELMNAKADELGMHSTHFTNPVGFDDPNHYSTAQDLTLLVQKFMNDDRLSQIVRMKEAELRAVNLSFTHKVKTTNKLLLEDPSVVGIKTGYTTEAKGNLAIRSIEGNADVVTIVLGSDDREGDTRKILDWVQMVYRW
jgi:serine-type D-Ala-D-Ala carboxypeptidase (penicillin-binding protein 5/6)